MGCSCAARDTAKSERIKANLGPYIARDTIYQETITQLPSLFGWRATSKPKMVPLGAIQGN